ncbi:hypothetical protein Desca_2073 [Desulfotomaculum nigrificans CO-1-SRB]|uniref:Uncharacterized protein n=1 Tax=Desulfotomaculum nigrificans (strain DSM 14880 / VKM B-2319 / CO-1-SRB) TaxID=868595 RepID=F6B9L6_DESCC|nr:hypothetical protein [Desulfotomaculum nigrificans]AEF94912.1 hypothetical protein Desca_2073 [Desulfotomaculum nigrificans CO-1-SRB]
MDEYQARFLDGQSPFTLFLILILLILGTERDVETYLENAKNFVLETRRAMENVRNGYEGMQANIQSFHAKLLDLQKK